MAVFNCKSCGGDLEIQEGTTVVTCEYCGRQQTVPSMDNEKKVNLFNRANRLRSKCDFDKAASVYESIVAEFPQESEAYWGLCLCKFGIEYVDDPGTANKIPTCHRTSYESIFDDQNFNLACENADALAVNQLRNEAKEIHRLQKEILEIAKNEQPFDIFICYKESDENGSRTIDSELAHDIYDVLTEKGYKVFYSRITLKAKLGQDYEPYIFSALNSAKVMLSIGTKYEYFNAVWVRNEWSRFLSLMKSDKSKMLIPCYRDIDPYDIPKEFGGLQGQDLSSPRAFQDLVTNIEKIIPKTVSQPTAAAPTPVTAISATEPLIKRAFMCLEDGDWNGADKCCEKILDIDPENARAYLAKLCLELKVNRPGALAECKDPFDDNGNFKKAVRFADDRLKNELNGYSRAVIDRIEMTEREILDKAEKYYEECDYEAAENWFKKISSNKQAKERINLIGNIKQFTPKCLDIKSSRERELSQAFETTEKLSENKRLSRALLLSSTVWMACSLVDFFFFLDSLPGILITLLVCNIAAVIICVKHNVGKRAVLPIIILAVIGFFANVRFHGFIGVIPFAALAVFVVSYWLYGKKYDNSLTAFGNIRKGLHSDINGLKAEYETIPRDIKSSIIDKIFGDNYWNSLSKPDGYSDESVEIKKSGPLFAIIMCLIAVNIAVPFIIMAINADRYDDYYSDDSSVQSSGVNPGRTASQWYNAVTATGYFRDMDVVSEEDAERLFKINIDNCEDYFFAVNTDVTIDYEVLIAKPKAGKENVLKSEFDTYYNYVRNIREVPLFTEADEAIGGTVTGTTDNGYYYIILHRYGDRIASEVFGSGSLSGSTSTSGSTGLKADIDVISTIFNTKIKDLMSQSTNVSDAYFGYSMTYKGADITVMTDKYTTDNVLNSYPTGLDFPIQLLVHGKNSCTIDELIEIFGDNLKVKYTQDDFYGYDGYEVTAESKYRIIFTNGTGGAYQNENLTEPFTWCTVYNQ